MATGRAPRRRSRPELEKREELGRLRGLERELGGALGPHEGDEDAGLLNLAREGVVMANRRGELVGVLWLRMEETRGGVHAGAQRGEGNEPGASTSPGDAGKQAAACPHGRSRCCAHGGRVGQGAGDPYRITVATPIFPLLSPCENQPKFELKSNFHQNKSCAKFYKLQNIFKSPELILSVTG